jgi:hypothetical protein
MTFSEETIHLANDILKSSDLGGDFIEHHGVKGQKHGVRRYQNEDGSLTALGRQHYGIFDRMRNYFSPASKGYRAAQKQKKIDEKIKYQQKVNELKRLKSESKEEEYRVKQMKREDRDERKARKFDQKMREKELESKERQFNLQQKTLLDIQKQRDTAQAAREQAQREYQTQQEIAKGKTLLGRLQKGAKMVAAISGIAGSGKKIAEAIGVDTSKFVTEWKAKYDDGNNGTKTETSNTEKPKAEKEQQKVDETKNVKTVQENSNNEKTETKQATAEPNQHILNKKYNFSENKVLNRNDANIFGYGKDVRESVNAILSKGVSHNISNEPPSHAIVDKYKNLLGMAVPTDKKTATEKNRYYSEGKRLSLQDAAEDDGVEGFRNMAKRFTMSPEARRKERQERKSDEERAKQEAEAKAKQEAEARAKAKQEAEARAKQEAEAKAKQEALEQARDIKRRWDNFYKFQRGSQNDSLTKSDTGRFITSISPSKIADMLLGKVPTEEYPHISLGKAMDERIGQPTDYRDEFKKRKDWQRKQRFGHDDMQEDAGEIEDAE